jgi:hypothetical protein
METLFHYVKKRNQADTVLELKQSILQLHKKMHAETQQQTIHRQHVIVLNGSMI